MSSSLGCKNGLPRTNAFNGLSPNRPSHATSANQGAFTSVIGTTAQSGIQLSYPLHTLIFHDRIDSCISVFRATFNKTRFDQLSHFLHISTSQHLMTFLTEAWFWRGTQSAIFYYASCAPCTRVRDQRKKRKEAKQARTQREMTVTEGFQQALPSCTNAGWDEEIVLGPGPPPKRLSKKELRKRDLLREKLSSTYVAESAESDSAKSITRVGTASTPDNNSGKSMSPGTRSKLSEESWYSSRHQRKDEPLWGRNSTSMTSLGGISSIAQTIKNPESYYHPRNPEINDFNPPIISNIPLSPAENLWMLQPPPRAKVMEGKIRAETCHY